MERIGDDNGLALRLDNGKAVELDPDRARHIDHGYVVENARHFYADRVLLTGEGHQLAEQQAALSKLNPHTKEVALYTSDGVDPLQREPAFESGIGVSGDGLSSSLGLEATPELSPPEIDFEGYGLGL